MSLFSGSKYLADLSHSERRRYCKGAGRLCEHLSSHHPDVKVSESQATKFIAIGNAGLSCGFSEEDVRREITGFEERTDGELASEVHDLQCRVYLLSDVPFALIECCCPSHGNSTLLSLLKRTVMSKSGQSLPWYPIFIMNLPRMLQVASDSESTTALPPGLRYLPEFITEEKEALLIKFVEELLVTAENDKNGDVLKNRTTLHFGYQFRYGKNNLDFETKIREIPSLVEDVLQNLVENGCVPWTPDQLTVNVYDPGQGIPSHVDTHSVFEDGVCSLSVGGAVLMDFSNSRRTVPVLLQPRSLVAMLGESRYAWKHGIVPRNTDSLPGSIQPWRRQRRISFTFRCSKRTPCHCSYPEHCDSQNRNLDSQNQTLDEEDVVGMRKESVIPEGLEEEYVYQVYENIAPHFSETRHKAWPRIAKFVAAFQPGSVVLDAGCGNGKYLGLNDSVVQIGCDRSQNLASICRSRGHEVFVSDILSLPFLDASCEGVICIAVIHHLSSEERRIEALTEIARVLAAGGRALVYVWAMEQKKDQQKSTYLKTGKTKVPLVPVTDGVSVGGAKSEGVSCVGGAKSEEMSSCRLLPVHVNRTEFLQQDVLVPWHLKKTQGKGEGEGQGVEVEKVYHRFYHVFREGELRQCCQRVEGVRIVEEYYDEGNWCLIFEKLVKTEL